MAREAYDICTAFVDTYLDGLIADSSVTEEKDEETEDELIAECIVLPIQMTRRLFLFD